MAVRRARKDSGLFSKKNLMSLFIVVVMTFSVLGFVITQSGTTIRKFEYNGFSFVEKQDGYHVKFEGKDLAFDYSPEFAERTNVSNAIINTLSNTRMMYVTYEPNSSYKEAFALFQYRMSKTLWDAKQIYVEPGLTEPNEFNVKVVTCRNATSSVPVIYLKEGNETKISISNSCVVAEFSSRYDVPLLENRLVYGMLGIIS